MLELVQNRSPSSYHFYLREALTSAVNFQNMRANTVLKVISALHSYEGSDLKTEIGHEIMSYN